MQEFHESDFYREYKYIRNQFRKYDSIDLLVKAFEFLYKEYSTKQKGIQKKQPWQVLLLIKWILIDDEFSLPTRNKLTEKDFIKILNSIRDLAGKLRMPNEYEHFHLFFRNLSYQQFIYQFSFNTNAFTRQIILFSNLNENHFIKSTFRNEIGIKIIEFVHLSILLLARFNKGIKPVQAKWFSNELNPYKESTVLKFLENISLSLSDAREYLLKESNEMRYSSEFYEQTPLKRYPLLKIKDKFYPYNLNILYRGLEHFIYDSVREINPGKFMNKFGPIFEDYVRKNLEYAETTYKDEKDLENLVGSDSKVTDFLINEGRKSIFIDAKGVEMSYLGKVSHQPHIIKQKVKTSALKGIKQAYEVISNLKKEDSELISDSNKDNYLLIVTYKELYLGNGKVFEEAIAQNFIKKLIKSYDGEYLIPMEHIYFITIDSLELWIEMIRQGKITFAEGLEKAVADDKKSETQKFDFMQHVLGWNDGFDLPDFLEKEFDSIFEEELGNIQNS